MKKTRIQFTFFAALLSLSVISIGTFKDKQNVRVSAASIDINDYTQCNNAHNSHNASALLSALRTITSPGKSGSYDGLYETYKAAYLKPNGRIFDYYSSFTNYDPDKDRAGSYKKEGDCFNREHSIPQSWWGGGTSNQGSDPFIVVPTDGYVNNGRSNFPFGIVSSATKTYSNSKLGSSSSYGYSGTVFEPDDSVKGDFARIYFYAIAKYKNAATWSGGNASSCFSGSESKNYGLTPYAIKLFSYWSELDPVSEWELSVNDDIAPIQGNRNPFIDHPEYANTMWGNVSGYTPYTHGTPTADGVSISTTEIFMISNNTTKISAVATDASNITWSTSNPGVVSISSSTSASSSPITLTAHSSGNATITASATINGETYSKTCSVQVAATKQVTSISISGGYKTRFALNEEFSFGGIVTASYNDGDTATVTDEATFSRYDLSVTGDQNVTVSYFYGGVTKTTSYAIIVSNSGGSEDIADYTVMTTPLTSSNITSGMKVAWGTSPTKLAYGIDSNWVRCTTTSLEWLVFTLEGNSSGFTLKHGDSYVYTADAKDVEFSNTKYSTFTLNVSNYVYSETSGIFYFNGSGIRPYDSGSYVEAFLYPLQLNKQVVSFDIETVPSIVTYEEGETLSVSDLVISREYDDGTTDTYTYLGHEKEFTFNPSLSTLLTVEDDNVEVIYREMSCFYAIEVREPVVLDSIYLTGDYIQSFIEGDNFTFGGTVNAYFSNGTTVDVTSEATFTGYNLTVVSNQTVTVSYTYRDKTETETYDISVAAGTLSSISLSGQTINYTRYAAFAFDGVCTATFENGYQKVVTPSSVSSPDMTTVGSKEVTVSYTYNNKTVTVSYTISVNSYRDVYEVQESQLGSVTYKSGKEVVIGEGLTTDKGGFTAIETDKLRMGSGSNTGSITVSSTSENITRVVASIKSYGSDSSVHIRIGGDDKTITNAYKNYEKTYESPVNSVKIETIANNKRAYLQSITIYTSKTVNIGQTEDCMGLESFININMHMDYVENLGYCSDSEHHYYSTAKEAFNNLNEHQRSLFTTNVAYKAEWNRLQAWASFNGDNLDLTTNELVKADDSLDFGQQNNIIYIIVVISAISSISLAALLVIKKRKRK